MHQCEQCEYKSANKRSVKRHVITDHTSPDKMKWFYCAQCDHKTKQKDTLVNHIRRNHMPQETLCCEKCEFVTTRKSVLDRHRADLHGEDGARHRANVKWNHCDLCSFKTKQKGNLTRHKNEVHSSGDTIKWFKCEQCDHRSKQKADLKKPSWLSMCHSEVNWFKCQHCHFQSKRKFSLDRHIKRKHSSKKK